MQTFKKHLDKILIALGTAIVLVGAGMLGANLGNVYTAVDRIYTDSSVLDRLENAGFITDLSLLIMVVGGLVLVAGIVLLVRRLIRH